MMWLSTNLGFLSIVSHPTDANFLLVRARRKNDIDSWFPDAEIFQTPWRYYLYRATIRRETVAARFAIAITDIDYGNFKSSVKDTELHHAYTQVWAVMSVLQTTRPYGGTRPTKRKPNKPTS